MEHTFSIIEIINWLDTFNRYEIISHAMDHCDVDSIIRAQPIIFTEDARQKEYTASINAGGKTEIRDQDGNLMASQG